MKTDFEFVRNVINFKMMAGELLDTGGELLRCCIWGGKSAQHENAWKFSAYANNNES